MLHSHLSPFKLVAVFALLVLAAPWANAQTQVLGQFPVHKQSKFFDFYFMRNSAAVDELPRFADGFVRVVHRQFFKADYEYPIKVLVLQDREKFQAFMQREYKMETPPGFGVFIHELNLFATYESSGLGTFAHEIMHPLVEANLPLHPVWATEGIPSFFEKFYGYWKGDELVIELGFQNPWRIQALGADLPNLDLKQILAYKDTQGRFRESEQRMVAMFMWKHKKFKPMLKLIENGVPPEGYQTWFEAAMEMKVDEVLPLWQAYLKEVAATRQVFLLPLSTVLPDEESYKKFVEQHGLLKLKE